LVIKDRDHSIQRFSDLRAAQTDIAYSGTDDRRPGFAAPSGSSDSPHIIRLRKRNNCNRKSAAARLVVLPGLLHCLLFEIEKSLAVLKRKVQQVYHLLQVVHVRTPLGRSA